MSKEEAEKETAPDKSVPTAEANSQTRQVSEDVGAGDPPDPGDGGTPTHQEMATTQPSRTTGEGDTAPDKGVPTGEAEAQTPGAQKEGDPHDGRGDPAPDGDGQARAAEGEAGSQTREVKKEGGPSDPGSTAWEHKDVALGEKAEALVSQLGEVIRTFTEREKAEGGASKGAGRIVAGIKYLLTNPNLLKECAEMPTDELIKALDELGAARQAAKKAKAKKAKKKAERKAAEAAEAAAKAAGDGAADDPLTKALAEVNVLREQVEKMASEDGKRILLNGTGLAAVLRSPEGPDVFKGLEDAFKSAQEEYEKDPSALKKAAMEQAGFRMTAAKMMVGESWRERTRSHSRLGPGTAELFTNRRALPADPAISYG